MGSASKYTLPVICKACGRETVTARRDAFQVVIRCETCGARIFAYYTDPGRRAQGDAPAPETDPLFERRVERELLNQVTASARALYTTLRRYTRQHGYAPTLRELQQVMGWSSVSTVRHHLVQLERIGLIERDYATSRGIRLPHAG